MVTKEKFTSFVAQFNKDAKLGYYGMRRQASPIFLRAMKSDLTRELLFLYLLRKKYVLRNDRK